MSRMNEQNYLPGTIRERLQELMKRKHIKQTDLAEKIGVDNATLSRFINGKTDKISPDAIVRMAKEFEVLDAKGKILSINPAAAALFGAAGNSVGVDFLAIERSHKMNRATTAALETGHTSIREERGGRSYSVTVFRYVSGSPFKMRSAYASGSL